MSRKPKTEPETNYSQLRGARSGLLQSTLRPSGEVEAAAPLAWVSITEALDLLTANGSDRVVAFHALWRRILTGLVPVTCDLLSYETSTGKRSTYRLPGPQARLAEQLDKAYNFHKSGFRFDVGNGDLTWWDPTGEYWADAKVLGLKVDQAALGSPTERDRKKGRVGGAHTAPDQSPGGLQWPRRNTKSHMVLDAFHRRLLAGQTARRKSVEYDEVCNLLRAENHGKDSHVPSEDTWLRTGGKLHDLLSWRPDGTAVLPEGVAEKLAALSRN